MNFTKKLHTLIVGTVVCGLLVANETAIPAPDNTAINVRDKSVFELTADQHSTREEDVKITRHIRQDIMKDTSLSTYAKNIKIMTELGHVTLKGPVRSLEEKRTLDTIARKVAGGESVKNEIDLVKPSR